MNKAIKYSLIAIFWLLAWWLLSLIIGNYLLFPTPFIVFERLGELVLTGSFWISLITSLARVMLGILVAIVLGTALGLLCAKVKILYDILYPIMTVIKATPVASFIFLLVLFIGKASVPSIITLLMVMPVVWANVYEGMVNVDKELKEVCTVYKLRAFKRFEVLYLPSVLPYFTAAILSSIGLGWNAGIAAEILYPPLKSIGLALQNAKQLLITEDIFAWTLVVIILSLVFEMLLKLAFKVSLSKKAGEKNENK
jgi:NitT/TauT family transport system permease protein